MNEIITRLGEIEEKADALLSDARQRRDQLSAQEERDKRAIDERYAKMEEDAARAFEGKCRKEAFAQVEDYRARMEREMEQLGERADRGMEALADEIARRVIDWRVEADGVRADGV